MTQYLILAVDKWGNIVGYDIADDSILTYAKERLEEATQEQTIFVKLDQIIELIEMNLGCGHE